MNNLLIYYFRITILCLIIVASWSCERTWNNPTDSLNKIEPDTVNEWIISELNLNKISEDKIQLSWSAYPIQEGLPLSGYKIDKKMNNEEWIIAYEILPVDSNTFIDSDIDTQKYDYQYKVYGFADTVNYSGKKVAHTFNCGDTFYDLRDGNTYKTVKIGYRCWFKENLRYLPKVYYSYSIVSEQPRYFVYGYEGISISEATQNTNYKTFGTLYNYGAANIACPEYRGWRMPKTRDWDYLLSFYGNNQGGALKDTLTMLWEPPNTGATDSLGFGALPGGYLKKIIRFKDKNYIARFWGEHVIELGHNSDSIVRLYSINNSDYAYSIRCTK